MTDRLIPLQGVRNFRDFGGYATQYGAPVQRGRFYRSGHFAMAEPVDLAIIDELSIAVQVDLRRPDERERQVNRWPGEGVRCITHDGGREGEAPHQAFLQQTARSAEEAEGWMVAYYQKAPFKPHHIALFRAWFEALLALEPGEAALINCAAGKDRTGILCGLTLMALGVSEADILIDYELTNHAANVDGRLAEATAYYNNMLGKDYAPDVYRPFIGVRRAYLEAAFEAVAADAGSLEAYLEEVLGVDASARHALRNRFLDLN